MYFPSKRDAWLGILLWGVMGSGLFFYMVEPDTMLLFISVPLLLLAGWVWFFTGYTLTEDQLIVRCGPFRRRVFLENIQFIRESRKLMASAALSVERLEIHTGLRYPVIISPRDKEEFVQQLQERNPKIKIDKGRAGKAGKAAKAARSGQPAPSGKKRPSKKKKRRK